MGGVASIPQERKAELAEAVTNDLFIPPGRKSVTFHSLITRKKNVLNQLFVKAMTKKSNMNNFRGKSSIKQQFNCVITLYLFDNYECCC